MSSYRFLLDENVSPVLRDGLLRLNPSVEVLMLGEERAPPLSTQDPEILTWLSRHDFCLVTHNRSTMPGHLGRHIVADRHVRGVFAIRRGAGMGAVIQDLFLIWSAAGPDDYADRVTYVPL